MPLNHNEDLHSPAMIERTLRPAAVEQAEPVRHTIENDPHCLADVKVQACQTKLDALVAVDAAPAVIARAQKRLSDARLDVMERMAGQRADARAKALAETKQHQRDEISREQVYRLSADTPTVTIVWAGIRVILQPERPQDPTRRLHVHQDIIEALQVLRAMTERIVGGVRKGHEPVIDRDFVIRDLKDRLRRGIAAGAVTIEIVED
jgi:hypothetical protein